MIIEVILVNFVKLKNLKLLSILIPNFNYKCHDLVCSLAKESQTLKQEVEILVCDDSSTLKSLSKIYDDLSDLKNVRIISNSVNLGREKTRIKLANESEFSWLLFLDSDVIPKDKKFIVKFLNTIQTYQDSDVIFGGVAYGEKPVNSDLILRWKYGKSKEEKKIKLRQKYKYLSLVTGAICLKKSIFISCNTFSENIYGLDIYLAYQLKSINANIIHIQNPVYHLGLETNSIFLSKTKEAWRTLILLENKNLISKDFRPVQKVYVKLKTLKMCPMCKKLFDSLHRFMKKRIVENSSLFWFDVYRMLYYCNLKNK